MSVVPAAPAVPVTRESFGIPADEDPWSQVPDPTNPLNTARAFFEHFLQDNGGLRKENDGEPRRYANVFFDFRRGRSKYYRDVLGIDNGKVSTLASQDWQLVKSTEYGKKFWKDVADETARLYDTRFPGQRQRQPIYPTLVGNRPLPLAAGTLPSVLAPPLPASPPRNGRPRPPPINIRRRSTSQAQAQSSPSRQRTTSVSSASGASLASPVRPSPRYSPYGAAQSRYSPPGMPVGSSLPTHYEAYSHPSPIYYATSTPVTPLVPVAPPPHVLPTSASHSHSYMTTPPTQPLTQVPSAGSEASYPSRSLSVDTNSLAPPSMQLQRHSLDMGVFAYEGTSAVPAASGAPSWPPAATSAAPLTSPTASYYQMPATSYISHTPAYPYAYTPVMSGLTYDPARSYSPNPACAPVTHIDPTLFAGTGLKWYDHSQGISPTSLAPDLPRTNSTPMLAGDYEGYHAWTPEMQP